MYRSCIIVRVIKSRRLRWAGHITRIEEGRSIFKILTGKPMGYRPLGRPRCRWEDNIRMYLEGTGIYTRVRTIKFTVKNTFWMKISFNLVFM